jgi:arylsulfatase
MEAAGIVEEHSPPRPGKSLLAAISGDEDDQEPRTLWWLHEGNRALRQGHWKISAVAESDTKSGKKSGQVDSQDWELYQLDVDRTETNNLADSYPQKVAELGAEWQRMLERHIEMATQN